MARDFYDVLGVDRDASAEEIKQAFRTKAAQYHPDVSDEPDADEKFKQVKKAKEVLTDEEQRELYEQLGHDRYLEFEKRGGTDGAGAGAGGGPGAGAAGDFFGGGGGDPFETIFDQFFSNRQSGRSRPRKGNDLRTRMRIDLEEAFEGATKRVTVDRPAHCDTCGGSGHPPDASPRRCPECDGTGQITRIQRSPFGRVQRTESCDRCDGEGQLYEGQCPACDGDGIVEDRSQLEVDIPAGIRDGQTLRMQREGAPGAKGGPAGDLLIEVSVSSHPDFRRDQDDLIHELDVSFPQAALGDRVTVPTMEGDVEVRIPAGTQHGDRFRLEGRGMPRVRGRGRGDQLVEVHLEVPERLTEHQREAIEALAAASDQDLDVDESLFDRLKGSF